MDDGIELNFAAPASGAGDNAAFIKRQAKQKGGRWTDRAQARKDARHTIKQINRRAAPASAASQEVASGAVSTQTRPAPVARPAPAAGQAAPTAATSSSRPAALAQSSVRSVHAPSVPTRTSARPTAPAKRARISPPPIDESPIAGPSRQVQAQTQSKSKAPQFISSLFSSNPVNSLPSSSSAPTIGAPSNAPLTGDTNTFPGIGLDPLLVHHLTHKMGLQAPTAIQRSALPLMLSQPLDISRSASAEDEDDEDTYEGATANGAQLDEGVLRDIFIQSQTGSGKTLTYLLPIVQTLLPLSRLSYIDRSIGTLAVILAPTRELAQQIEKVLEQVLSMALSLPGQESDEQYTRWLVSGLLTGGSTRTHEKARLRKGVPILVSTPGRLLDHLQNTTSFQCAKTLFLVLDEADRLMDLGFEETIQGIIRALDGRRRNEIAVEKENDELGGGLMRWPFWSRGRRTVLCSATVDAKVERLSGAALHDPIVFRAIKEDAEKEKGEGKAVDLPDINAIELPSMGLDKFTPPSQLAQKYVVVPTKLRLVALVALLRSLVASANEGGNKIIVFLSSTDAVDFHWKLLGGVRMDDKAPDAIAADAITLKSPLFQNTTVQRLHGSLPLATRRSSLAAFAAPSDSPAVLLATSVASRGLDLPLVRAVVQYDLPTEGGANEYVHRVGRTARAGKGGEAWAVVGTAETGWVDWVEGKMGAVGEKQAKLGSVSVENVLKKGFGGRGYEYETRATEIQLAFERWVLADEQNAAGARKAFASFVKAYSTHPLEEKAFFHPKTLHLGHLAKAFALREAPSALAAGIKAKPKSAGKRKLDEPTEDADDDPEDAKKGGKETTARNETERRMYEAVRKAGRAIKSGGALGEVGKQGRKQTGAGGAGAEFQVMGTSDLEKMVAKRR